MLFNNWPFKPQKILELIVEVDLEESPSSSQPPGNQGCKRKCSKIIKERAEGTTVVEWTLRKTQAETPTTPKQASTEMDSLLKIKKEKEITGELDSGLNLKKRIYFNTWPLPR